MLRLALATSLVLALGGQLDGLLPQAERPRAALAPRVDLPPWPRDAQHLGWPPDGRVTCHAACALEVAVHEEGELWVAWDGMRVRPFAAALDGTPGVPALDAIRLGAVTGGEDVRLWGDGEVQLVVVQQAPDRPNLVALAPTHLGEPAPGALGSGCLPQEAGTRCLRFTTGVANNGGTPLRLADGGDGRMLQDLPDGPHAAGAAAYHAAHGHFHYARFMAFGLHAVDAATGLRGDAVLSSSKTGFCMVDWGGVADAEALPAKTFWRAGCEPHQRRLEMGVNPGWYDVYRWFLPEQVLDVAAVPDGTYELVVTVDPDGTLVQQHTLDDRASVVLRLEDGAATVLATNGLYRFGTVPA